MNTSNKGFTIVEISIVMVIIGLLVGGIIMGTSLLRHAELRSAYADIERYRETALLFRQKYKQLPGDLYNATSFWGQVSPGCTDQSGVGTCNGNGDENIGGRSNTSPQRYEHGRFWQHLVLSGMLEGNYPGTVYDSPVFGTDVPASKVNGGGYSINYLGNLTSYLDYFDGEHGHVIYFGSFTPSKAVRGPLLTTEEAYSFDSKYDDGIPSTGKIKTTKRSATYTPNCTTSDVASTARYDTARAGKLCALYFTNVFENKQ